MASPDHLGSEGSHALYALAYVRSRLQGFEKDVEICLTPAPGQERTPTHAYFPAFATCSAFLEHLTALYRGKVKGLGASDVAAFAQRFMRQPDYDAEIIRVLFDAFRNPVAHLGIANGVWIDRASHPTRRLTWKLLATAHFPPCELVPEEGNLVKAPPWPCPHTHRVVIRLKRFALDLRSAATEYAKTVSSDEAMQAAFFKAMRKVYPI